MAAGVDVDGDPSARRSSSPPGLPTAGAIHGTLRPPDTGILLTNRSGPADSASAGCHAVAVPSGAGPDIGGDHVAIWRSRPAPQRPAHARGRRGRAPTHVRLLRLGAEGLRLRQDRLQPDREHADGGHGRRPAAGVGPAGTGAGPRVFGQPRARRAVREPRRRGHHLSGRHRGPGVDEEARALRHPSLRGGARRHPGGHDGRSAGGPRRQRPAAVPPQRRLRRGHGRDPGPPLLRLRLPDHRRPLRRRRVRHARRARAARRHHEGHVRRLEAGRPAGWEHPLLNEPAGTAYTQGIVDFNPVIQAWGLSCIGSGCQPRWSHAGSTDDAVLEGSSGSIYVGGGHPARGARRSDRRREVDGPGGQLHPARGRPQHGLPRGRCATDRRPGVRVGDLCAELVGGAAHRLPQQAPARGRGRRGLRRRHHGRGLGRHHPGPRLRRRRMRGRRVRAATTVTAPVAWRTCWWRRAGWSWGPTPAYTPSGCRADIATRPLNTTEPRPPGRGSVRFGCWSPSDLTT